MSSSKKYFWLKLKDDFFRSREIKKLRNIAGGDTYTIIYLKIQLLSIKKEGVISYEGTEENLAEQLSLELDEDVENVKVTLAYLERNKLMEQISEDDYLLNKVVECVGSETKAAERMRKLRAKSNNVTPQLPDVQNSYTEIEIEIEKELEKDIDIEKELQQEKETKESSGGLQIDENLKLIAKEYEQCGFGTIDFKTKELLEDLLEQFSTEWIVQAFSICVEANKRTIKYAKGILNNWKTEGGMKLGGRDDGKLSGNNTGNGQGSSKESDEFFKKAKERGWLDITEEELECDF